MLFLTQPTRIRIWNLINFIFMNYRCIITELPYRNIFHLHIPAFIICVDFSDTTTIVTSQRRMHVANPYLICIRIYLIRTNTLQADSLISFYKAGRFITKCKSVGGVCSEDAINHNKNLWLVLSTCGICHDVLALITGDNTLINILLVFFSISLPITE